MNETTDRSRTLQRNLELVVQTGLLLEKNLDLQSLAQTVTEAGLRLCGAEFGALFYNATNADGERDLLFTFSGLDRENLSKLPIPRNTEIFSPTLSGAGVVRSRDIAKDPLFGEDPPRFGTPQGYPPVRSYLAVPVKSQTGEVLGGLHYGHRDADIFGPETEELVRTIAAHAAVAIENLRLRAQLRQNLAALQKSEAAERETSKRIGELAAIVESADDAILSKDLTGHITSWNDAATRILGYAREEMIGESILKIIPPELQSEEAVILSKIRAGKRIEHYETIRLTKRGAPLEVSISISPVRDGSGTIIGASKILRDISDRKKVTRTLIAAEKIAAAGRMAATIAHEINNPLEAVMNLLFLARAGASDPEQIGYLASAQSEIDRVSHIARQTLGFYREYASAGLCLVSDLVTSAIEVYGPKCKAAHIHVETRLNSKTPIVLRKGEMTQVISNLIANSIQAMPDGGVLSVSVQDVATPDGGVLLTVCDTGTGIPPNELPKIFDAFFTTRGDVGTGIGLFVTKQFVEGHGGTIEAESSTQAGSHGTKISILLPLQTKYAVRPA